MYLPKLKSILFGVMIAMISFSTVTNASISNDLPVKFIRFYANQEGDQVRIRWITESEYDNDFFTVERSIDMILWETLEIVPGSGTSPGAGEYEYYDTEPKSGLSYYRIKQTDTNSAYDFSHIEKVEFEELMDEIADVAVAPNPLPGTGSDITVNGATSLVGASVKLIDISGKEIQITVDINDTEMTITPFNKVPGLYFLIIQKRKQSIVKKIQFK
jgi:hypothetical protein